MYADRHHHSSAIDPRSLGIAVALNGGIAAVLLLVHPAVLTRDPPRPPLKTYNVPVPPPDTPPPPKPANRAATPQQPIAAPRPRVELPVPQLPIATIDQPIPLPLASTSPGPIASPEPAASPALVTIGPEIDPAHRADLQPTYPASELRAEREGVVTVRVLIGVDGRVRDVQRLAATSDAFFTATRDQALRRWRFRPATRGDVPVEAWRSMTIRFVIPR